MIRRRAAVDFLDEHPARRFAAASGAVDQHTRHGTSRPRPLGLGFGQPCQQLPIATGEIGSERAADEDDRRAHAPRRSPAG